MCFTRGKERRGKCQLMIEPLPEDVIILILRRLPVKSLLRFKCVSRSWFSIISDFQFTESHYELAAAPTSRVLYIPVSDYASQTRAMDLDASSLSAGSVVLNSRFLPETSMVEIRGSCRGFVLLLLSSCFCLWNPSTGNHKLISRSPIMVSNVRSSNFTFFYGFGYDVATDDYLVVLASYHRAAEFFKTHFELFSLRANTWSRIESTHLDYDNAGCDPRTGILRNGILHWLAIRHEDEADVILAFNLRERSFSEVPLPPYFELDSEFCDLCLLGGLLSLTARDDDTAEIWVMEEYNVQTSWTKLIVLSMVGIPTRSFFPICSTKSGDIVGSDGDLRLVKCNANGQQLEHYKYCNDSLFCEAVMYTESLLSLPVDTVDTEQAIGDD